MSCFCTIILIRSYQPSRSTTEPYPACSTLTSNPCPCSCLLFSISIHEQAKLCLAVCCPRQTTTRVKSPSVQPRYLHDARDIFSSTALHDALRYILLPCHAIAFPLRRPKKRSGARVLRRDVSARAGAGDSVTAATRDKGKENAGRGRGLQREGVLLRRVSQARSRNGATVGVCLLDVWVCATVILSRVGSYPSRVAHGRGT